MRFTRLLLGLTAALFACAAQAFAAGNLTVTLAPAAVISAGAQWRVDGGTWRNSGTTVKSLAPGSHTVDFKPVSGWITPASRSVAIVNGNTTAITETYVQTAALRLDLTPASGQWRIDGGAWQASGTVVPNLSPGNHAIAYAPLNGYTAPPGETISLTAGQSLTVTRSYVQLAQILIGTVPSTGQWRANGGAWQPSGTSLQVPPGAYTIEYASLPYYDSPPNDAFTLEAGGVFATTRYYVSQKATLRVNLTPAAGQWRIDGGTWQNSGTQLPDLTPGTHTLDYLDLGSPYNPLPSETISLGVRENATLARTYPLRPGALTVTLTPAQGQWRLDGGAWRASGSTATNLAPGAHTVDYAAVDFYFAPPAESVTIPADVTTTLARTYTPGGDLLITAVPASAARVGIAQWRIDGGAWQNAGVRTGVAAGSHTLEFKPAAGWLVPATSTLNVAAGELTTVTANYNPVHRLRFFINQNLTATLPPAELQARIAQYAAHVQTIFHRESVRRLTFDPATDITVCAASPFSGNYTGTPPETGFEVWVYTELTDNPTYGSYGGYGGLDASGAGGAAGLHWDQVHDPATLQPDTPELSQYWNQIDAIVHELEHTFGAGLGEYYSPGFLADPTGVEPILATTSFAQPDPSDHFWGPRPEYWRDPLVANAYGHWRAGNPRALPDLLAAVRFAPATQGVIASLNRNFTIQSVGDLAHVRISIVDANTGQLIPNATVRAWNRRNPGTYGYFEQSVAATATPGVFEMSWSPYPTTYVFSNWDNMKIVKTWAAGYAPKAQWTWIYDAQKTKCVDGSSVFEITIALSPQ